jgi:predicted transcriptional regulator
MADTKSDWLNLLQKANTRRVEKPPKGFKLIEELAKELGRHRETVRRKVPQFVEAGVIEKKSFMVLDEAGGLRSRPFYRLIKK